MRRISSVSLARPSDFRIEKCPYKAKIHTADGEMLKGEVFLGTCSPMHPGGETLIDLVNDTERAFLPFRERGRHGVHTLNRSWIVMVETSDPKMVGLSGAVAGTEPDFAPVVLKCATTGPDPVILRGLLYLGNHRPERQRTADVLNGPRPFVVLRLEHGSFGLVNKERIGFAFDG